MTVIKKRQDIVFKKRVNYTLIKNNTEKRIPSLFQFFNLTIFFTIYLKILELLYRNFRFKKLEEGLQLSLSGIDTLS